MPLPTEKDEVWRYSRIDQLDLDRFPTVRADTHRHHGGPGAAGVGTGSLAGQQPRAPFRPHGDDRRRAGHGDLLGGGTSAHSGPGGRTRRGRDDPRVGGGRPTPVPAPERRLRRRPPGRRRRSRHHHRSPHRGGPRGEWPRGMPCSRGRSSGPRPGRRPEWWRSWSMPAPPCSPTSPLRPPPPSPARPRRTRSTWWCRSPRCRWRTMPRCPLSACSPSGPLPGCSPTRPVSSVPTPRSRASQWRSGGLRPLRTDSALIGVSGTSLLRAAFIGRDDQMLDFRTLQDHPPPRTTSDLLFMGAVADAAPLRLQRPDPGAAGRRPGRRHADQPQPGARRRGPCRTRSPTSIFRRTTSDAAMARRSGRWTRTSATTSSREEWSPMRRNGSSCRVLREHRRPGPLTGTRPLIGRALAVRSGVHGD